MTTEELNRQRVAAVQEIVDHMEPGWVVHEPGWHGLDITHKSAIVEGAQLVITFTFKNENTRPSGFYLPKMGSHYFFNEEQHWGYESFKKTAESTRLGQRMKPVVAAQRIIDIIPSYAHFFGIAEQRSLEESIKRQRREEMLRSLVPAEYDVNDFLKGLNDSILSFEFTNGPEVSVHVYPSGSSRVSIHDADEGFIRNVVKMAFDRYQVEIHKD